MHGYGRSSSSSFSTNPRARYRRARPIDGRLRHKHRFAREERQELAGEFPPVAWVGPARWGGKLLSTGLPETASYILIKCHSSAEPCLGKTRRWLLANGICRKSPRLLFFPDSFLEQARLFLGRFVWTRAEERHLNPAARYEGPGGRQLRLIVKLTFPSKKFPGNTGLLFAGITGLSSGARRWEMVRPTTYLTLGGPMHLITIQTSQQWSLTARAWRPATVEAWRASSPESFWDTFDLGLIKKQWAA